VTFLKLYEEILHRLLTNWCNILHSTSIDIHN